MEAAKDYAENCNLILFSGSTPEEQENNRQLFGGVFTELQQLTRLFLEWDWGAYFSPEGRLQRYNHLNPLVVFQVNPNLRSEPRANPCHPL